MTQTPRRIVLTGCLAGIYCLVALKTWINKTEDVIYLCYRYFKQLLLVFLIQQMAAGLFRVTAGLCRTMIIANTGGALSVLLMFMLGGFILPKSQFSTLNHHNFLINLVF